MVMLVTKIEKIRSASFLENWIQTLTSVFSNSKKWRMSENSIPATKCPHIYIYLKIHKFKNLASYVQTRKSRELLNRFTNQDIRWKGLL